MTLICELFPTPIPNILEYNSDFITGIEYEIEDLHDINGSKLSKWFMIENDNSLRNCGKEFKTYPFHFEDQLEKFQLLHTYIKLGPEPFTERTSIHVHVNVRELTEEQLKELVLTYALLEPIFFDFCAPHRLHNIFCVPLSFTHLSTLYCKDIKDIVNNWKHKYTAFNLLPVKQFGTVEFRHLEGTGDFNKFKNWLTSLKSLYDFVKNKEDSILTFIYRYKSFDDLIEELFPYLYKYGTNYKMKLQDTLLDVKLSKGGFNS